MSYGIAAYGEDGKLSFHSDYSSVVYAGEMLKSADPARPVYVGDYHIAINAQTKTSNYEQGWIIQYRMELSSGYLIPFYKPAFTGQEIAIMDVVNEGTTWVVNLLYSGLDLQWPAIYAFAPLAELPSSAVSLNDHGIVVYDENSDLVFTDSKHPLRVDEIIEITHNNDIKLASKGACGNSTTCHVNFTSDTSTTYTGSISNTTGKLYHIVPSAYGGLAYENSGSGTRNCGLFGLFSRKYAWSYKSWSSFRGTVKHPRGGTTHVAGWQGDFAGAAHQYTEGSCGFGGFLGALIGVFLIIFTAGAATPFVIGGALAGFVIGELTVGTAPSLKAYTTDETFDTSNPVNLLVTDTSYYGIVDNGDVDLADRLTFSFSNPLPYFSAGSTFWLLNVNSSRDTVRTFYLVVDGVVIFVLEAGLGTPTLDTTSITAGGTTYFRGPLEDTDTTDSFFGGAGLFYSVAQV